MSPPMGAARAGIAGAKVSDIPDSVVNQYDFIANFSQGDSAVADSVGSADMSLSGDFQDAMIGGESGADGDGTDDHGQASSAELVSQETFGVAFTVRAASLSSTHTFFGHNNTSFWVVRTGNQAPAGQPSLILRDDGTNDLWLYSDTAIDDDAAHAVIINKTGNSASDIDFYIDDMSTATSQTVDSDQGFDHSNASIGNDVAYWARNNGGSITDYGDLIMGAVELNSEPYSQSERDGFVSRRPEV